LKQLRRSLKNKIIGGVAAGLAEYLELDVTLVRLIWVLVFFAGGIGFFAYLICWIILPENTEGNQDSIDHYNPKQQDYIEHRAARRRNIGLLLIGLGLVFLLQNLFPFFWGKGWPLLLVIAGLYIIFNNRKGDHL
jgi:phage shock protein C